MASRTRPLDDRRHLWRSAGLYALIAVPVGFVLAVVTKNVSSLDVNPLFWLLLYAVALIPGGLAYAMLRTRHAAAALWPAVAGLPGRGVRAAGQRGTAVLITGSTARP